MNWVLLQHGEKKENLDPLQSDLSLVLRSFPGREEGRSILVPGVPISRNIREHSKAREGQGITVPKVRLHGRRVRKTRVR